MLYRFTYSKLDALLLKEAGKACREVCPDAKIILHSERTYAPAVLTDFFDRMKAASVDYDLIGLSYYPAHHHDLASLEKALKALKDKNYGMKIWIVETGYSYAWPIDGDEKTGKEKEFDYTSTYPYTEEGQRQFTADLITMLNKHSDVNGLLWWWPEDNGNKSVTDKWWNAALYNHDTGQPYAAFYELRNFNDGASGIQSIQEISAEDDHWYTIDGRRLNSKPSKSGLYIHQHKKEIVR